MTNDIATTAIDPPTAAKLAHDLAIDVEAVLVMVATTVEDRSRAEVEALARLLARTDCEAAQAWQLANEGWGYVDGRAISPEDRVAPKRVPATTTQYGPDLDARLHAAVIAESVALLLHNGHPMGVRLADQVKAISDLARLLCGNAGYDLSPYNRRVAA